MAFTQKQPDQSKKFNGVEIDPKDPRAQEKENVLESLKKSKEELVDRLEKIRSDKVSPGSSALDERANMRMQAMIQKEIDEVDALYEKAKRDFLTRTGLQSVSLDVLATEIQDKTEKTAKAKVDNFELTVTRNISDTFVNTADVYNIEVALIGAEKCLQNPKLEPLLKKLQEKKEAMNDEDYMVIVDLLNPNDLKGQPRDSFEKSFEATSAGALIHLMGANERFKLVEHYMDSAKKEDAINLIDTFISTGVITREQAEISDPIGKNKAPLTLFQIAINKGLLTREDYDKTYAPKFNNGQYQQELQNLRDMIHSEQLKDFSGHYSENIMDRIVGKPLVGGLLALWGVVLVGLNVMANHKPGQLVQLWKSPPFLAGLGLAGCGLEMATGTMQKGTGWGMGSGIVSRAIDSFDESSAENSRDLATQKRIAELYKNGNPLLRQYLDYGGIATLQAVRAQKEQDGKTGKDLIFDLGELAEREDSSWGSPDRREVLEQMQDPLKANAQEMADQLTQMTQLSKNLKVEGKDPAMAFSEVLKNIRAGNPAKKAPEDGESEAPASATA